MSRAILIYSAGPTSHTFSVPSQRTASLHAMSRNTRSTDWNTHLIIHYGARSTIQLMTKFSQTCDTTKFLPHTRLSVTSPHTEWNRKFMHRDKESYMYDVYCIMHWDDTFLRAQFHTSNPSPLRVINWHKRSRRAQGLPIPWHCMKFITSTHHSRQQSYTRKSRAIHHNTEVPPHTQKENLNRGKLHMQC